MNDARKHVAGGLSLANLAYGTVWATLLSSTRMGQRPVQYLALMLNVVTLSALLILFLFKLSRQPRRPALLLLPALVIMLAVKSLVDLLLRQSLPFLPPLSSGWRVAAAFSVGGILAALAVYSERARGRLLSAAVLLFPLVFTNFTRAMWRIAVPRSPSDAPGYIMPATKGSPHSYRVLWIIFDDWDYGVTFSVEPPPVQMPELERLRHEAFFASQVRAPNRMTQYSMPALLTGLPVQEVSTSSEGHVLVKFLHGGSSVPLATQPNIFQDAHDRGVQIGVVSSYFDYCSDFGPTLRSCTFWPINDVLSLGTDFRANLINQTRSLFETKWRSFFGQSLRMQAAARTYSHVLRDGIRVATDNSLKLVMLHFPVPHPPYFYDRYTHRFDLNSRPIISAFAQGRDGYLGNLGLVDSTLGELRAAMQRSGLWDSTAILLSSDHAISRREDDDPMLNFVPFILKLPNQYRGIKYEKPVDSLITKQLLLDILEEKLTSPDAVVEWMDRQQSLRPANRPIYPSTMRWQQD